MRRRPRNKKEVLTLGGQGDYVIAENELRDLIRILLQITNTDKMRKLVFSLLTNRELADVVRRIAIAKLITRGDSYDKIMVKASTGRPTISLIKKMLRFNPDLVHMLNPEMKWRDNNQDIIKRLRRGK
jgi:uncharacterized protein YerC